MAGGKHLFRYNPSAVIQVGPKAVTTLHDSIKGLKVLTADKKTIPKNAAFVLAVDVGDYSPQNLIPTKANNKINSSLLVIISVIDLTNANLTKNPSDLKPGTIVAHGTPLLTPQRKSKNKRILKHQTFLFPPTGFTSNPVTVAVRTVHHFFEEDDDAKKVNVFRNRRGIVHLFEAPMA